MRVTRGSHGREHFRRLYDANEDPWNYRASDYEKAKRAATIAALGGRRFRSALEVGCSIGVLTRRLADCCDMLMGVDFVDQALAVARVACADMAHVTFWNASVPVDWPEGRYDLIVLSEVLYFLSDSDNSTLVTLCQKSIEPNGVVLLVNWLQRSPDDPCSGDTAATRFIDAGAPWMHASSRNGTDGYRIDCLGVRLAATK
jgi:2-polyprenyl-3-methyl-5-hydroxy-6-metoxy-1,4-benzoquinol methylase